jgi:hypothetical protein
VGELSFAFITIDFYLEIKYIYHKQGIKYQFIFSKKKKTQTFLNQISSSIEKVAQKFNSTLSHDPLAKIYNFSFRKLFWKI